MAGVPHQKQGKSNVKQHPHGQGKRKFCCRGKLFLSSWEPSCSSCILPLSGLQLQGQLYDEA
eukprot:scaffold18013_cov48-Cyclotella_meneghiniana.AAC.6